MNIPKWSDKEWDELPERTIGPEGKGDESEEFANEMSAGREEPIDAPTTTNEGGTGSGVAPVSDITGHARGDTRPIEGRVPEGEDMPPPLYARGGKK